MTSPCKTCENRGCGSYHDECEKYREYRAEKDADCEERARQSRIVVDAVQRIESMKRKRNSNGIGRCHLK